MISWNHRLVFVHVPKCAGMAVEAALGGLPGEQAAEQHFSGAQLRRYYPEAWSRFHRFTVVRHPVERALSMTRFLRRFDAVWRRHLPAVDDETLLRDLLMSTNVLTARRGAAGMLTGEEEVLRFEDLETAWPAFAERRGLPRELPRKNTAPRATRRDGVGPGTAWMIATIFRVDHERFGYATPAEPVSSLSLEDQGAVAWAALRAWALDHGGARAESDLEAALDAFARWRDGLPEPAWRDRVDAWQAEQPLPLPAESPPDLVLWTERLHESVNDSLGKRRWESWSP